MPKPEWMCESFVKKALEKKGKDKRTCLDLSELMKKMDQSKKKEAWVVSIGWLFQQIVKCTNQGQETMRFAVDGAGDLYIEGYADADEIEGSGAPSGIDPPGWNNDWPEIGLP